MIFAFVFCHTKSKKKILNWKIFFAKISSKKSAVKNYYYYNYYNYLFSSNARNLWLTISCRKFCLLYLAVNHLLQSFYGFCACKNIIFFFFGKNSSIFTKFVYVQCLLFVSLPSQIFWIHFSPSPPQFFECFLRSSLLWAFKKIIKMNKNGYFMLFPI